MAQYCDPKLLENTWWTWILAYRVPSLEPVRNSGLLWTRGVGVELEHCVASCDRYHFVSKNGHVTPQDLSLSIKASFSPLDISLSRRLAADNFLYEQPPETSWPQLSAMIYMVCNGVAMRFHPPTEDIKDDLAHEALTQILAKIQRGKLQFSPGRAPAFNLLTTAIFRVMYSVKNKEKRDRDYKSKLVDAVMGQACLPDLNSLNVVQSLVDGNIKT